MLGEVKVLASKGQLSLDPLTTPSPPALNCLPMPPLPLPRQLPRAASQRARISASSSVRANLTLCTWPFCGKKNGSEESSALCCVVSTAADRALRLDVATGAVAAVIGKAGSSRCRSMSRSSSESRSRWPIREKPVEEGKQDL
jgi:hypothetical protein